MSSLRQLPTDHWALSLRLVVAVRNLLLLFMEELGERGLSLAFVEGTSIRPPLESLVYVVLMLLLTGGFKNLTVRLFILEETRNHSFQIPWMTNLCVLMNCYLRLILLCHSARWMTKLEAWLMQKIPRRWRRRLSSPMMREWNGLIRMTFSLHSMRSESSLQVCMSLFPNLLIQIIHSPNVEIASFFVTLEVHMKRRLRLWQLWEHAIWIQHTKEYLCPVSWNGKHALTYAVDSSNWI